MTTAKQLDPTVLDRMLEGIASAAVPSFLLPDVEVKAFVGANGNLYASVLLDQHTYPEPPLRDEHRPLTDSSTGRWWYDPTASVTDYSKPVGDPERERTPGQQRAELNRKLTEILTAVAAVNARRLVADFVEGMEVR